jgi:hypothetical protein
MATGVFTHGYAENKGVSLAPQIGFGSEQGIDNIGSYWFYCNASNGFGQKCLLCTTDLSHVTVFWAGSDPDGPCGCRSLGGSRLA